MKTGTLFFSIAMLFSLNSLAQNTLILDNNPDSTAQFTDFQSAINAAVVGDSIYIQHSEISYGNATINKQLNLVGRSHSEDGNITTVGNLTFDASTSNSFVSGLWINNINTVGGISISGLVFQNNYINQFVTTSNSQISSSMVVGNVINNMSDPRVNGNTVFSNNIFITSLLIFDFYDIVFKNNVIVLSGSTSSIGFNNVFYNAISNPNNITVENCIIIKPIGTNDVTLFSQGNDGMLFENCITYHANGGIIDLPFLGVDSNLNDVDPQFVAVTDDIFNADTDNYHLSAGSPAIVFGNDGLDAGVYNSVFNFNPFGFTNGIPIVTINSITNTVAPGANVEVNIQANSN